MDSDSEGEDEEDHHDDDDDYYDDDDDGGGGDDDSDDERNGDDEAEGSEHLSILEFSAGNCMANLPDRTGLLPRPVRDASTQVGWTMGDEQAPMRVVLPETLRDSQIEQRDHTHGRLVGSHIVAVVVYVVLLWLILALVFGD